MIVADANLVVAMLIEQSLTIHAERVRRLDRRWLVPPLFRYELASALTGYVGARKLERDDALARFRRGIALVQIQERFSDPVSFSRPSSHPGAAFTIWNMFCLPSTSACRW